MYTQLCFFHSWLVWFWYLEGLVQVTLFRRSLLPIPCRHFYFFFSLQVCYINFLYHSDVSCRCSWGFRSMLVPVTVILVSDVYSVASETPHIPFSRILSSLKWMGKWLLLNRSLTSSLNYSELFEGVARHISNATGRCRYHVTKGNALGCRIT